MKIDEIKIGMHVEVSRRSMDLFEHDFTGHVKGMTGLTANNLIVVEDQNGNCWSVDIGQIVEISD